MVFETINGIRHGKQKILFFNTHWSERPWEWVHEEWLENERVFFKGFFKQLNSRFELSSIESGCRVKIEFKIQHRYKLFSKLLDSAMRSITLKIFHYLEQCAHLSKEVLPPTNKETTYLKDWLITAHEIERARIEPKVLAKDLNTTWQKVMSESQSNEYKSRFSILFDIKCPHCRGSMATAPRLTQLPNKVECPSCDIDIDASSCENLSVTLRDASLPLSLSGMDFCSSDVSHKPLVVFQRLGFDWKLSLQLKPGLYALKRRGFSDAIKIHISDESTVSTLDFTLDWNNLTSSIIKLNPTVAFSGLGLNQDDLIFLEFLSIDNGTLSLAEALLDSDIARFIPSSNISTEFPIEMGHKTLLFTDVVGSTDLYFELGDNEAFQLIRKSFLHIGEICERHKAVLVKTIGDATMYAFQSPQDAIRAAVDLQKENPKDYLRLRISLHTGVCLSISTADGLDFFGDTVNICAKFQSEAEANEIVFDQLLINNQTKQLIEGIPSEHVFFELKGKKKRSFNLIRLKVC